MLTVPLKTFGGKSDLASRIVDLMPPHLHYVEPFAGGLAVLLARDPDDSRLWVGEDYNHRGVSEVVNDLDGQLTNFWRVVQGDETFARFRRIVEAIPVSRPEWDQAHAHEYGADSVADAVAFFVNCRQSWSGMGKGFTSITRTRTRRSMNGNVSEWLSAVDGLPEIHARLRTVLVENKPALEIIKTHDEPDTLFYLDPPYPHDTRTAKKAYGDFEMTDADHRELLATIKAVQGKVILSGYANDLYDRELASWRREQVEVPNNAAGGKTKRRMTEVIWCNFASAARQLFWE
jgi:DNA adenine methylase